MKNFSILTWFTFAIASVMLIPCHTHADVFISEFMADNQSVVADDDGDFSDWLELHNPSATPADITGYYLTDDPALFTKWQFPSISIPPNGHLLVFASGKDRTNPTEPLHASFQLAAEGEFLALILPDGTTLASAFSPAYPPQTENVSYGQAQTRLVTSILPAAAPTILIPTNAGELPPDWNQTAHIPGPNWITGSAPPAIGFDTGDPIVVPMNQAAAGTAQQSTTSGANNASLAIDSNSATYTQTLPTDNSPFWQVRLATESSVYRVVLHNRAGCCQSRLRDITVQVLSDNGVSTNFSSPLLNPDNSGHIYPAGPDTIEIDIEALASGPIIGQIVRVLRTPDPDLSGTAGQGTSEEASVLSLSDVEVFAVPLAAQVNLARTGSPAPTATQSTTLSSFTANLAIDGNLANFTHTASADSSAAWTLNLGRRAVITSVVIHNRDSCCGSRLRDITVTILDVDGSTVLYTSPLLNPENTGFSFPNGPDNISLDLPQAQAGQYVRIGRQADPDRSGTGGQGNDDEASVLSLGEVIVLGFDATGYRPFIRTDLENDMLGVNPSAFVRLPFTLPNPAGLNELQLNLRYDDGFIACLNGVQVAQRNAPASPVWNSSATASRDVAAGSVSESIDLTASLPLLGTDNVLAFHALNVNANDGSFLLQPELFATEIQIEPLAYLEDATPGTANDAGFYFGVVEDTRFSVDRGFFNAPFTLEIASDTPGASIYYSLDASEPGPITGILYNGPIAITNTTIIRARAFKEDLKASNVDTHTYLFLADVVTQSPNGQPPPFFPSSWGANAVDYGMDPNVIAQYSSNEWQEAFTQIPSISIVTEMASLFDPATGIYANALQHGIDWERPGSIELLDSTENIPGRFQENCGLRIRGGFSRNPQFVKHSLRVFFRRDYGAPKLNYPLFGDEGAGEFDTFDLRTSQNYSWPREGSRSNGRHDTLVRDVFCRDTLGALGQPHTRSRYYHLYLNGQYWGIYQTQERAEASYGETYFGGDKDNYDVVKSGNHVLGFVTEATDGNLNAFSNLWSMARSLPSNSSPANYFSILGRNADGSRNPALPVLVDAGNLIDYMLEIFYSGDGDAPLSSFLSNDRANNWFGMRDRTNPEMGFRFFNQDSEHTLGSPNSQIDRTGPFSGSNQNDFNYANPQWIHQDLAASPEYRILFADHVQRHFFNGGPLTPEAGTNRFLARASQITRAIRAYSARWGDTQVEPPYGESDWTNIIDEIVRTWFPTRTGIVLQQLRVDGLYPPISAPSFSQQGGDIMEGFQLAVSNPNAGGTIYHTLDGTDPRAVGGALSPTAIEYDGLIPLNSSTRVKARIRDGATWSALTEADFALPDVAPLRITELMYHPSPPTVDDMAAGFTDASDFDFLELQNVGDSTLSLAGIQFVNGISFTFTHGSIPPGQRLLLVKNVAAYMHRYGPGPVIAGAYGGNLNNGGERLRLEDALTRTILDFSFSDGWYPITDGFGFSLVIIDPGAPASTWDSRSSWRQSGVLAGSPGAVDPYPPAFPLVLINEVLTYPNPLGEVSVELVNLGVTTADIGGWWLTDDLDVPHKFPIPPGTTIPPGEFIVFTESDFGPGTLGASGLNLSSAGAEARLFSASPAGALTGYLQGWDFGPASPGVSFGRHVISTGADHLVRQQQVTLGATNAGPLVGPVVISEIMYRPYTNPGEDPNTHEFLELLNITGNPIDLFDTPGNTWKITGGVDFDFPPGLTLAPGEYLLIVGFDPVAEPATLADFRARYGIPEPIRILGPFLGNLGNGGEDVNLRAPELLPTGLPAFPIADRVNYDDSDPWPGAADGYGPSLQRLDPADYGNDPAHWIALLPTAANAAAPAGTPPSLTQHPSGLVQPTGSDFMLSATATGSPTLHYQWRLDGGNIPDATNTTLIVHNAQPGQSGDYRLAVYNEAGSIVSQPAAVTILFPPEIAAQPADVTVDPGENVTFTVQAASSQPLTYQWRLNGINIPGATNSTLNLFTVQFGVDDGFYSVAVTDSAGTAFSRDARLTILVAPGFTYSPPDMAIPRGSTVVLSAVASGTTPMGFRWRRGGLTVLNEVRDDTVSFLVITNFQDANAGSYTIVATNEASYFPGIISARATITILDDTDQDGIPDDYEDAHGMNPSDPSDASDDSDGDGMTAREEYIAGTDPGDPQDYLKATIRIEGAAAFIEFQAAANTTYTVLAKTTLADALWILAFHFPAQSTAGPAAVALPIDGTALRFYRLVTPAQAR